MGRSKVSSRLRGHAPKALVVDDYARKLICMKPADGALLEEALLRLMPGPIDAELAG